MSTILLSIKPEYVEKIFSGEKEYEFRKHIAKKKVSKIVIYSTFPVKKVVGEVNVTCILGMKKTPLWEYTKLKAGISRKKYRMYFSDSSIAYAYVLQDPKKYIKEKELSEYGLKHAPQSFVYLK